MSGGPVCKCKPRNMVIVQYKCNFSAFSGYRQTASDYSCVRCLTCGTFTRTKAAYVDALPMATPEQATGSIAMGSRLAVAAVKS